MRSEQSHIAGPQKSLLVTRQSLRQMGVLEITLLILHIEKGHGTMQKYRSVLSLTLFGKVRFVVTRQYDSRTRPSNSLMARPRRYLVSNRPGHLDVKAHAP